MLWFPVALSLGGGVYFSLRTEPNGVVYASLIAGFIAACLASAFTPTRFRGLPVYLTILLAISITGFCYSAIRTHTISSEAISEPLDRVMVEGWVEDVSGTDSGVRYLLRVHAISNQDIATMPRRVRVTARGGEIYQPGRFLRCFASLNPPPRPQLSGDYDFERQAFFQHLGAVGFVFGNCRAGRLADQTGVMDRFKARINAERRELAQRIAVTRSEAKGSALAAALMTGDRSFLSEEQQEDLRGSGLAHLLAISGLHLGLAAGVFYMGLYRVLALIEPLSVRFPVQKLAASGALLAITVYLLFSGASISTQRAYVMLSVVLLCSLFDQPILSFQTLSMAMIAVFIMTPWAVTTPGYQMSFASTGALISVYQNGFKPSGKGQGSRRLQQARLWVFGLFITSLVAGLATFPFALFHFDRAAPLGLLANMTVMPIISLVCVPLAAITAILFPFGWEGPFLGLLSQSLDWVLSLAEFFNRELEADWLPSIGRMPVASFGLLILGLLFGVVHGISQRVIVVVSVIAALIWWVSRPVPVLIQMETGRLFVREDADWFEVRSGAGGLKPLRFADVPTRSCRDGCALPLMGGGFVSVTQEPFSYDVIGLDGEQLSIPADIRADGFDVFHQGDSFSIKRHKHPTCRPWTAGWEACKTAE